MENRLNSGNWLLGTTRREFPYGCCSNQKGSLFVGLIVTMLILGTLGGAMVYVFGSSTFENVVGNFARRAYYAAESGMRFAVATYRNPFATNPETDFANLTGQTISFPNNSSATLTIQETVSVDVPTTVDTDQTINLGGNLTVVNATSFPDKNGFFQIKDVSGYFRYKQRVGNELQLITGPGLPRAVTAGTIITSPKDQYSVISKGTYQVGGIFGVSRTVEYGWVLSGRGSGPSEDPVSPDFDPTKWDIERTRTNPRTGITEYFSGPGASWGSMTFNTTEGAIQVWSTTSAAQNRFILGYNTQFFYDEWIRQNNYLTYDIQTKVKTWNEVERLHLYNYVAGLSFRLWGDSANYDAFNASFAQGTTSPFSLPTALDPYIIFWRDSSQGQKRELLAYKMLTGANGLIIDPTNHAVLFSESLTSSAPTETDPLSFNYWTPTQNTAIGWTPVQGTEAGHPDYARSGTFIGVGEQVLTLTNDWVVPLSPYMKFYHKAAFGPSVKGYVEISVNNGPWTVIDSYTAASFNIPWTARSAIDLRPYISSYPANLKIRFRLTNLGPDTQIANWSVDDVSIVTFENKPYLRDWSTVLVRIKELSGPSTPSTYFAADERVNEIEIFYGTTTQNGDVTVTPTTPLDNNRLANPRCVPTYDGSGNLIPCKGNWPPAVLNTLESADDKFTLVSGWSAWNNGAATTFPYTNTRTSPECKFELAGSGNEANAIIRTNCYITTTYPANTNNEVGLSAFGAAVAGNVYFDDFGISTGGTGGGKGFIIPIQQ